MKIILAQGEEIIIQLADTDGEFKVRYGLSTLEVEADLPDSDGRSGVIYSERFGDADDDDRTAIGEEAPVGPRDADFTDADDDGMVELPASKPRESYTMEKGEGDEEIVIGRHKKHHQPTSALPNAQRVLRADRAVRIADLEVDTDWYRSSRKEFLVYLSKVQRSVGLEFGPGGKTCAACAANPESELTYPSSGGKYVHRSGWHWEEELYHHIEQHGLRPEDEFMDFIIFEAQRTDL